MSNEELKCAIHDCEGYCRGVYSQVSKQSVERVGLELVRRLAADEAAQLAEQMLKLSLSNGEYRTHDYEHSSASGMGDVALLLGWTLPPDDDGFWYREPHGPVHDGDLRPLLVEELAALATLRDRAKATLRKIVCVEEPDDGVVLLSNDSPTHFDEEYGVQVYDHDHFSPLGDGLVELWNVLNGPKGGD